MIFQSTGKNWIDIQPMITIKEIAKRAGISIGTEHYFPAYRTVNEVDQALIIQIPSCLHKIYAIARLNI
jgi:hypothetical protein